jgi:hypothetical protein
VAWKELAGTRETDRRERLPDEMKTERRKTLETLIEFAELDEPASCWDPARARELLRTQASRDELEEIGAAPALLDALWPESDER